MTPDEAEACRLEEECCRAALLRHLAMLKAATTALERWAAGAGKNPIPANVAEPALAAHLDAMALYRVQLWRQRFA